MQIGRMRETVIIERRTLADANAAGEQIETWAPVATVFAEVRSLGGSEAWRAKQIHADSNFQVTTRYSSTITTLDRFNWHGVYLYPVSLSNDIYRQYSTFLCRQTQ